MNPLFTEHATLVRDIGEVANELLTKDACEKVHAKLTALITDYQCKHSEILRFTIVPTMPLYEPIWNRDGKDNKTTIRELVLCYRFHIVIAYIPKDSDEMKLQAVILARALRDDPNFSIVL